LLGVSYFGWRSLRPHTKSPTRKVMLAVLPFDNLSGDREQDYFSDGLTEEMIAQLGGLDPQRLGVIARASAMQYKHSPKGATQIGRELGVDYILEGSVRREARRARVTAQLIQVSDQTHLWTQSYERELRDLLTLQKDVAGAIAQQIRLKLSAETHARLASTREVNPEAHEAYLKGLYFWNKFTVEGFLKSKDYFQLAIDKDPEYAPAYAGLAASHALLGQFGVLPSQEAYPRSKTAATRAIGLDEKVSFAHSQLGFIGMFYDHDWAMAEREFRRAIEINPSDANAHEGYAFYFVVRGLLDQAEVEIQRAHELDPLSLVINSDVGYVQLFARQYDRALRQLQQTLEMDAHFSPTHWVLAQVYEAKGLFKEANSEDLKTAASASSANASSWIAEVQRAYDTSGWKGSRRKRVELMFAWKAKGKYCPPYGLAIAYIQLGEKQKALDWLEKAAEEHFYLMVFVRADPRFDSLRDEPRFQTLLRRMDLPP
jgi:TolB-like protein